jgi:hypothetical protein
MSPQSPAPSGPSDVTGPGCSATSRYKIQITMTLPIPWLAASTFLLHPSNRTGSGACTRYETEAGTRACGKMGTSMHAGGRRAGSCADGADGRCRAGILRGKRLYCGAGSGKYRRGAVPRSSRRTGPAGAAPGRGPADRRGHRARRVRQPAYPVAPGCGRRPAALRAGRRAQRLPVGAPPPGHRPPGWSAVPCPAAATVTVAGPASGPGWTGTRYAFSATRTGTKLSGTVTVDRHGRTRALVLTQRTPGAGHVLVETQVLTFSGFGAPVTVTPPPADQTWEG